MTLGFASLDVQASQLIILLTIAQINACPFALLTLITMFRIIYASSIAPIKHLQIQHQLLEPVQLSAQLDYSVILFLGAVSPLVQLATGGKTVQIVVNLNVRAVLLITLQGYVQPPVQPQLMLTLIHLDASKLVLPDIMAKLIILALKNVHFPTMPTLSRRGVSLIALLLTISSHKIRLLPA
jgi:hypothetical protein